MSTHDSASSLGLSAPRARAASVPRRPASRSRVPVIVAGLALVAVLTTHLVNFASGPSRSHLFDASSSASWSHVLIAGLLVVGTLEAVVGFTRARGPRGAWACVALSLAAIALAEVSPLHTNIDRLSWGKLVYVPLLLVLSVCLWRLSAGREHAVVRVGLATLVLSYAIHVFGPHVVTALGWGTGSWAYQVKVGLKQGTELAGWLLIVIGIRGLVAGAAPPR